MTLEFTLIGQNAALLAREIALAREEKGKGPALIFSKEFNFTEICSCPPKDVKSLSPSLEGDLLCGYLSVPEGFCACAGEELSDALQKSFGMIICLESGPAPKIAVVDDESDVCPRWAHAFVLSKNPGAKERLEAKWAMKGLSFDEAVANIEELLCQNEDHERPDDGDLKKQIVKKLQHELSNKDVVKRSLASDVALSIVAKDAAHLSPVTRKQLANDAVAVAVGYGPLEALLADPEISEIVVNGTRSIYIEKRGQLRKFEDRILDKDQLASLIDRLLLDSGRRVDESSPLVDARLADGSRVNIIIPPLAIDGPAISIRRFSGRKNSLAELEKNGTLTHALSQFFQGCVESRLNFVISGGTGSGKTTFLNALSNFISDRERIVSIEDAAELNLQQEHVVRLESRPPNIEQKGEVAVRQLLRNALRMRPDRIIVGECRGAEALDMLQAMSTGHDGSLTTVHASSARDALFRIETMVMFAGFDLPWKGIRQQISRAIDIVVHLERRSDGVRVVEEVASVEEMEGDAITMCEIYRSDEKKITVPSRLKRKFDTMSKEQGDRHD